MPVSWFMISLYAEFAPLFGNCLLEQVVEVVQPHTVQNMTDDSSALSSWLFPFPYRRCPDLKPFLLRYPCSCRSWESLWVRKITVTWCKRNNNNNKMGMADINLLDQDSLSRLSLWLLIALTHRHKYTFFPFCEKQQNNHLSSLKNSMK